MPFQKTALLYQSHPSKILGTVEFQYKDVQCDWLQKKDLDFFCDYKGESVCIAQSLKYCCTPDVKSSFIVGSCTLMATVGMLVFVCRHWKKDKAAPAHSNRPSSLRKLDLGKNSAGFSPIHDTIIE